jgi:hypothetical protein
VNKIKAQREWSEFEVAQLKRLHAAGLSYVEIGAKLGRSRGGIANAIYKFDLRVKKRPILRAEVRHIRDLAARGYSDRVIGLTVGRTRTAISQIRERQGIPCGRAVKTAWRQAA